MNKKAIRNNTIGMVVSILAMVGIILGVIIALSNGVAGDDMNPLFWISVACYFSFLVFVYRLCDAINNKNGGLFILASVVLFPAGGVYTFFRMLINSWQASRIASSS